MKSLLTALSFCLMSGIQSSWAASAEVAESKNTQSPAASVADSPNSKSAQNKQASKNGGARAGSLPTTFTTFSITNGTTIKQYFYLGLTPVPGYPAGEQITNINQVQLTGNFAPGEGVITPYNGSSTEGWFYLNKLNTASCAPGMTISARVFTNGTAGTNDSQCFSGNLPQYGCIGPTYAEFTLNVDSTYLGDETVDISEVNGCNALWSISLPLPQGNLAQSPPNGSYPQFFSTVGYQFPATTTVPTWGTFNSGQLVPVNYIANNPGASPVYSGDRNSVLPYGIGNGNVGVYPNGCDQCTSRVSPGCTTASYPPASQVVQTLPICQVMRNYQYQNGGNVGITLKQFPFPATEIKSK